MRFILGAYTVMRSVIDVVGLATTFVCGGIIHSWRSTVTGTSWSSISSGRTTDFVRSGFNCAGWTDTSERGLIEEHALGAAGELFVIQSSGSSGCNQ